MFPNSTSGDAPSGAPSSSVLNGPSASSSSSTPAASSKAKASSKPKASSKKPALSLEQRLQKNSRNVRKNVAVQHDGGKISEVWSKKLQDVLKDEGRVSELVDCVETDDRFKLAGTRKQAVLRAVRRLTGQGGEGRSRCSSEEVLVGEGFYQ